MLISSIKILRISTSLKKPFDTNFGLAPLINCTTLALLDAGIPMHFMPSAGTACLRDSDNDKGKVELIQGPSWEEQTDAFAVIQAVFNKR